MACAALSSSSKAFLETFRHYLGAHPQSQVQAGVADPPLTEQDLERKKQALKAELMQKPLTMTAAASRMWEEIISREYWFTKRLDLVSQLPVVSLADLRAFFEAKIMSDRAQRDSIEIFGGGSPALPPRVRGLQGHECAKVGVCPEVFNISTIEAHKQQWSPIH